MFNAVTVDGEVVAVARKDEVANVGTVCTSEDGRRFLREQGSGNLALLEDQVNGDVAVEAAERAVEAAEQKDLNERAAGLLAAGATAEEAEAEAENGGAPGNRPDEAEEAKDRPKSKS